MRKYLLLIFSLLFSIISTDLSGQNSVTVTAFLDQNGDGIDNDGFVVGGLTTGELFLQEAGGMIYNHVEAGGVYTFDNSGAGLPDGTYTLHYVETPWTPAAIMPASAVYAITLLNVGGPTMDNDVEPVSGVSAPFGLIGGAQMEMDIDLGLYSVSAIGDFVWEDINGDGLQDGELGNGLAGLTVTLLDGAGLPATDTDNMPVPAEVTEPDGSYLFGNLPPGDYIVEFTAPVGPNWFATTFNGTDPDFSNDSDADPNNSFRSHTYTIDNNIIYNENIDAGFVQAVSIGDQVWEDVNGNGVQDPGDDGINGVTVSLLDDLGAPAIGADGIPVPDQVTAGDGNYMFTNVAPGDYRVQFSLPAPIGGVAWYPTEFDPGDVEPDDSDMDSDAINDSADPNYLATNIITVESAETDEEMRIDAGFWLPARVGDFVFCDENGNGIDDDGAGGVDGVDVRLIDSSTGATAQDAEGNNLTTTTATGGMYLFELVPPGTYSLEFSFTGATPDPPFSFTLQNDPNGLGTDFVDSDVDPTNGQTEEFDITSQDTEEEQKWDAGVYQVINIFGTIWIESDGNNMYDGEMGPGNVFMEIFNAADGSKVDDTFSNAGEYEFIGLPPGEYYISYSTIGTPLESATSCPGQNDASDMVDNDDNGNDDVLVQTTNFTALSNCDPSTPPEIHYIDFCYFFDCNEENMLAATACSEILDPEIICDISILGTFCNLMPTGNSGGAQPNPLCPGGGAPHNISWFAFVAYGGDYEITVTPTGCTGSTTGMEGVQIGLYTDCTFTESVYCDPNCSTNAVSFASDILEEGQTYYFFIDGCSGSVCSYEVAISGNPLPPNLLPDDVCIVDPTTGNPDCQDATYCPNADVTFIATDFDLTVNFAWTVTTISGTPYAGDPNPITEEELLTINFPDEGVYEICLIQVDNGCDAQQWNGNICRTITIEGIDDEEFMEQIICEEDLPFFDLGVFNPDDPNGDGTMGWQDPSTVVDFGIVTGTVMTPEGCTYQQEFELMMHPESEQGLFEQTLCSDDLPIMVDQLSITEISFGGQLEFTLQDYLLVNESDVNGCDSTIDIHIEMLQILNGSLVQGTCLPEGIIMTFEYNDDPLLSTDISFYTFEWLDPMGNVLDDDVWNPGDPIDNLAPTDIGSGQYTLNITINKNGTTCMFSYTLDVDFETLFPPTPNISGPGLEVCEADSIVTYTAIDFGDAFGFTWDFPSDVASSTISGDDGEIITINWSGSNGGAVTLVTENGCGMSEEVDIMITVIPQPTPSFDFTTEVCVDSCTIIEFIGDDSQVASYTWDFDGGTENNGTGGVGPGPHCVSWSDSGDKTISLSYIDNAGCESTIAVETVTVVDPITPPTINCNPNTGEVSFTWNDVPDNLGYEVEVTSISEITMMPHEGVLDGTTFTVGNLNEGETVTIILTIFTDDACQMITATSPGCTSQNCIAPEISLSSDILSFCLDENSGTAQLSFVVDSGENGTGVYSGPGIVDPINGIFDPDSANIGINTITFVFMTDAMPVPCIGNQTIDIEVLETPTAAFVPDVDTICITDQFTLEYTGTAGVNDLTWDYGVDGSGTDGQMPTVTYTSPGDKTIRLTVTKDGCESESFVYNVHVQPELEPVVVTCLLQEIDQVEFGWNSVPGATGYEVTIDGGTPFITDQTSHSETGLNPDDVVQITVTVLTDNRCGGSTDTHECTAQACPTFDFTFDNPVIPVCVDGSNAPIELQATATGGVGDGTYTWSGQNVTDSQFDPNGLPEGSYTLLVTYEENSCESSDSMRIEITTVPTAQFSVDNATICVGETVNILYEGSQLPNQTITWTPDGLVTAGANPDEYTATFNDVGTFDIQLDVVNGACTTEPDMATITVEPELVFGDINCDPEMNEITFSWDAVDCATEYEVFIGGISQGIQTETEFTATDLSVGQEVTIEVIAVSGCACGNVMNTRICEAQECTPVDLSLFTLDGVTTFCNTADLAPIEIVAQAMGSMGNGTFTWTGPGIDQDGMLDPAIAGVGTHTIYYDFLESAGCPYQDSITITINELPTVTQQFEEINCYDQLTTNLEVIPMGGTGNYDITLNGAAGDLINEVSAGDYTIVVTDDNMCSATTSVTIGTPAEPSIAIDGSSLLILGDSSSYSINSGVFAGSTVDSVVWMANGVEICNDPACFSIGTQSPTELTVYDVTVHYNSGCSVTTSLSVEIRIIEPPSIVEIPNIISPNGDGDNDEWRIVTNDANVVINSIQIFDRWGNQVWGYDQAYSPLTSDVFWDGEYKGKTLQPGVYVYFIDLIQNDRSKIRSGDITIIN